MKKTPKPSAKIALPVNLAGDIPVETAVPLKKTNGKTNGKENGNGSEKANGKRNKNSNGNGHYDFSDKLDNKELLRVMTAVRHGDFSVRMPVDKVGIDGKICDTVNDIISLNAILMEELILARNTIGKQGHLNHRVTLPGYARGSWRTAADAINSLISDLVHPTIEIAHVISSVAKGNLSQEMPLKIGDHVLQGEFAKIAGVGKIVLKKFNFFMEGSGGHVR